MSELGSLKIHSDTSYDNCVAIILKTSSIQSSEIKNNILTLSSGITGLSTPISDSDAVPKSYVQGAVPIGVPGSIQINNNGFFYGDTNLKYISSKLSFVNTTSATFTDNILSIITTGSSKSIQGILLATGSQTLVTKRYVDFYNYSNIYTTTGSLSVDKVCNGTYICPNNSLILPGSLAGYIATSLNTYVTGSNMNFSVLNSSDTMNNLVVNSVNLNPVNFTFPISVPPNYCLNLNLIVGPTTSAYIVSKSQTVNYGTVSLYKENTVTPSVYVNVTNKLIGPSSITSSAVDVTYSSSFVNSSIIIRSPASDSDDIFDDVRKNGNVIIQNVSANTITLNPDNCIGSWTFVPTGSILIPSNTSLLGSLSYVNNMNTFNKLF